MTSQFNPKSKYRRPCRSDHDTNDFLQFGLQVGNCTQCNLSLYISFIFIIIIPQPGTSFYNNLLTSTELNPGNHQRRIITLYFTHLILDSIAINFIYIISLLLLQSSQRISNRCRILLSNIFKTFIVDFTLQLCNT